MSLEHFVDGLMSNYVGCGEEPKFASIENPKLRNSKENVYDLGQSLGIVSKIALGGWGLYSLYTIGTPETVAAMSVTGPLALATCLKWVFVDPLFVRKGRKPITLGGIVKKFFPSKPEEYVYPDQPRTPAPGEYKNPSEFQD